MQQNATQIGGAYSAPPGTVADFKREEGERSKGNGRERERDGGVETGPPIG